MISRNEVSKQMIRSICCRSNKVESDKDTVAVGDLRDTVFIFISSSIMARSLLGSLITGLENKGLTSTQMIFKSPNIEKAKLSLLSKYGRPSSSFPCVFSLWKGRDAFRRVQEVVSRIGKEYSIARVDILYSENIAQTRKEAELWFDPAPSEALANGLAAKEPEVAVATAGTVAEEVAVTTATEIPSSGPPISDEEAESDSQTATEEVRDAEEDAAPRAPDDPRGAA